MWSLTGVSQPVVGERWWRVESPAADKRDPFPGSRDGTATGRLIDRTANRLPRPLLGFLGALLPAGRAHGLRTRLLRAAGHHRVDPSATFVDLPIITSTDPTGDRLTIGAGSFVNARCSFDLGAAITVGDHVYLADRVQLLTTSGGAAGFRGPVAAPISIGPAAWLGAGAIVGPGVRVGAGAIVAAGSVVDRDVPAHTMVAGAPAVVVKRLSVR